MAGIFLSLDGIDGCGKSTQIELLCSWLESLKHRVVVVRDPGGTALGEAVREILLHRTEIPLSNTAEMLLYMASRAQLVDEKILPALESGSVVISDRFLLANVVYQGVAGGQPLDAIWEVGRIATRNRLPDMTILLDIDPSHAFSRLSGTKDRLESRGIDYMNRVRHGYLEQIRLLDSQAVTVDASQSIQTIQQQIRAHIASRFPAVKNDWTTGSGETTCQ